MAKQKVVLLSLDVSTTTTGYAVLKGDRVLDSGVVNHKSKDWIQRVRFMANTLEILSYKYGVTHVAIEDTYVSRNVNTVKKLCIAQGIILGCIKDARLVQVYPVSWKSHFGLTKKGATRAKQKQNTLSLAETMTIIKSGLDDEADAILMGKYVMSEVI